MGSLKKDRQNIVIIVLCQKNRFRGQPGRWSERQRNDHCSINYTFIWLHCTKTTFYLSFYSLLVFFIRPFLETCSACDDTDMFCPYCYLGLNIHIYIICRPVSSNVKVAYVIFYRLIFSCICQFSSFLVLVV
jgi:hypothetical protein